MNASVETVDVAEIAPYAPRGLEIGLRNYWYPILQSKELGAEKPLAVTCLGEDLVVWRDGGGRPGVLADRCLHRGARLSVGRILGGQLQCIFHGLRFDGEGRCVLIPWEPDEAAQARNLRVQAYPVRELGGYVWAYLGDGARFPAPPLEQEVPQELLDEESFLWFRMPTEIWDASWLLAIDGGDALHAVTLHAETQAVADVRWEGGAARRPTVRSKSTRLNSSHIQKSRMPSSA